MLLLSLVPFAQAAPAELPEHVQERIDRALDHAEATGEQRSAVYRLVGEIAPQARALHEEAHALRGRIAEVLLAPTVDRGALEDLRLDAVDLFDRATGFAFAHVADVAEVFTPAQRQKLHELRQAHHAEWAERARGGHPAR